MSEFEDRDLAERLRRLAGPAPDDGDAFAQVRRRVGRARRRRAAAWSGGAAVVLLAVAGAYAAGTRQSPSLRPATTGDVSTTSSTLTDAPSTTGPTTTGPGTTAPGGSVVPTSTATTTTARPPSASTSPTAPTSTTATTTPAPSTSTPGSTSTTAPAGPVTRTFSGTGGSITVRLQNGTLTLLSTNPAAGFSIDDTRTEPTRVEVRLRSASHSTKLRVDVVNGQMSPTIEEEPT